MISFDFHINSKTLYNNTYSINRTGRVYSYFKNEYRNNKGDFNYLLKNDNKELSNGVVRKTRKDLSFKIQNGSMEHMYFMTEYNHVLAEDMEHNIIIPEEISGSIKIKTKKN